MTTPLLNGANPLRKKLTDCQQACADALADALQLACEGRINAVGIIVQMDDGIATIMQGTNAGALNLGCDDLKQKIWAEIFQHGNVAPKAKSKILRAR